MKFPSFIGRGTTGYQRTRRQYFYYIAVCAFLSLIVIAISVPASFGLVVRDIEDKDDTFEAGVNIDVELISVDPVVGTLLVDIDPFFYDPDRKSRPKECPSRRFDLFIDENLSATPSNKDDYIPNSDIPEDAAFQLIEYPCNYSSKQNWPTFRKSLKLFLLPPDTENTGSRKQYGHIGSGLQAYPFDQYYSVLYMYGEEHHPDNSTDDIPITIDLVRGVAANFKTDYKEEFNDNRGLYISFTVERSIAIKVYCMAIIITNWIVSLVFLWITVACLFWKERVVKELFAIPITVLFAFSAVRGSMPGAPAGFGAFIDYVGILPNFAILTVCSFVLICLILVERIRVDSVELEKANLDHHDAPPQWPTSPMPMPSPGLDYSK